MYRSRTSRLIYPALLTDTENTKSPLAHMSLMHFAFTSLSLVELWTLIYAFHLKSFSQLFFCVSVLCATQTLPLLENKKMSRMEIGSYWQAESNDLTPWNQKNITIATWMPPETWVVPWLVTVNKAEWAGQSKGEVIYVILQKHLPIDSGGPTTAHWQWGPHHCPFSFWCEIEDLLLSSSFHICV